MTSVSSASSKERLPSHLRKYVAEQHYERYTPEEQATWRYILRQLRDFLGHAAHPCYVEGLEKTGISVEQIPRISEMDLLLQKFGWGAVPVSGFIPPAAFMEFQSLGILPIACDMRSLDHLLYTPAPDIVHEAAGHAPILIHPEYAEYLKSYAQVAKKAIISKEDLDQYEAIRKLSDVKENPSSTKEQIQAAEKKLVKINQQISHVSEAALLSRMNWWTAEYGLIGSLKSPRIYGAGLLSSLGESRECLKSHVKKIPLDVSCVEVGYDITEPQPQLFVTPSFAHLQDVLEDLAKRLAYQRGGVFGMNEALKAKSVNTVELDSGLQISGVLGEFQQDHEQVSFVKFFGPCQLSYKDQQLPGHGTGLHAQGYSSPLGPIKVMNQSLTKGAYLKMEFPLGIQLSGTLTEILEKDGKPLVLTFKNCLVVQGEQKLFDPDWGQFDLACGNRVTSVFGGPADRVSYGEVEDFVAERVPAKALTEQQKQLFAFYADVREARKQPSHAIKDLWNRYLCATDKTWLLGVEILELSTTVQEDSLMQEIRSFLLKNFPEKNAEIEDGIRLAKVQ